MQLEKRERSVAIRTMITVNRIVALMAVASKWSRCTGETSDSGHELDRLVIGTPTGVRVIRTCSRCGKVVEQDIKIAGINAPNAFMPGNESQVN